MTIMQNLDLKNIADQLRNFKSFDRSKARRRLTDEDFTPSEIVNIMLDEYPADCWADPRNIFIDNSCGNGNILAEILIRKLDAGLDFETALSTIRGVEFEKDNAEECRERLLCGQEHLRHIVEKNIVCADALTYNYTFGEPETFGNGLFEIEQ
jgi:hypothetical protein